MVPIPPAPSTPRLKLRLTPAAETAVRSGHPWVFSRSVRDQNRDGVTGEIAAIYDRRDALLALGFYDATSPIRVRILHTGKPVALDAAWWRERLQAALRRRDGLFDPAQTNGWRCLHGESDGWPGLVLDRYGSTLVLKIYTAVWQPRLDEIVALIRESLPWATAMVLRLSRQLMAAAGDEAAMRESFVFSADDPPRETVVFLENGLRFEADVRRGQKTGFFLDQRDNRARVESMSAGRDVLNAFSFSGAFSVYAARGGARSVTDLDLSPHALAGARRNMALNAGDSRVAAARHHAIQADAFDWLARGPRQMFDLIVVDPPSLAPREAGRAAAIDAYRHLNGAALARLNSGGILVAASCSAHVTSDEFGATVRRAARDAGRPFQERWTSGHAADHPATFPEAQYLKCVCLQLD